MERRIYEITDRDRKKAAEKEAQRQGQLAEIEEHKADAGYWRRRRTTYGLAKRDASLLLNAGSPDYYAGRGQGMLDVMSGLPYSEERGSAPYNQGYHDGYYFSLGEMRDYVGANPNFAHLLADGLSPLYAVIEAARAASQTTRQAQQQADYEAAVAVSRQHAEAFLEVVTPYNADFVVSIKRVPGATWDRDRRVWRVPAGEEKRARRLIAKYYPACEIVVRADPAQLIAQAPASRPQVSPSSVPAPAPPSAPVTAPTPQPCAAPEAASVPLPTPPTPAPTAAEETAYTFWVSSGNGYFADMYHVGNTIGRKSDDTIWVITRMVVTDPNEDNDDFDYVAEIVCRPATEEEAEAFAARRAASLARRAEWQRLEEAEKSLFAADLAVPANSPIPQDATPVFWKGKIWRDYGSIRFVAAAGGAWVWRITNYYDGYDVGLERPSTIHQFEMTPERQAFLADLARYQAAQKEN